VLLRGAPNRGVCAFYLSSMQIALARGAECQNLNGCVSVGTLERNITKIGTVSSWWTKSDLSTANAICFER